MKKYVIYGIILFFFILIRSFAHEDEKHNENNQPDTMTVVNGDTIAINGILVDSLSDNSNSKTTAIDTAEYDINFPNSLFEHLHNKLIHFPIALIVIAFVMTIWNLGQRDFEATIKITVFVAGVFSVAAYFTGVEQQEVFMNTSKEWLAEQHETFGIITLISVWIWFVFLVVKSLQKYAWLIGLTAFMVVSVAGFYGGVLAH